VQRQSVLPREIVVVVDHNRALLERVQARLPDVIALDNNGKPGASSARNSGVAVARGSLIAFLDDDAIAEPDWLEQLAEGYENPGVLGVGGALEPVWQGGRPQWFPDEFNWVVGCTYKGMPEQTSPVRNLIAANMSVRRVIFESVGGFRSGYGNVKVGTLSRSFLFRSCAGDEETEFCIRALRRWPQSVWLYMPRARVCHRVPAARADWKYFLRRCYDEGFGKALLSQLVGAKHGLASERIYTRQTLPQGVVRGLCNALFCHDLTGLARAGAIVIGLAATTAGYLIGAIVTGLTSYNTVDREVKSPTKENGSVTGESGADITC
jgi:glycosyltransferase involved in cell wall biosynthesis